MNKTLIINMTCLLISFALGRTAVFIQLLSTSLVSKTINEEYGSSSAYDTVPIAFLYYGGTFIAPIAARIMQTYGRKRGFLFGCLLGMIGGSVNLIAVCIYAEESTGSAFGLLCMGSAFLGFANGFVQFFRFAAAESWPERKGLAISITLLGGDIAALIGPSISVWTKDLVFCPYGGSYIFIVLIFGLMTIPLFLYNSSKSDAPPVDNQPPRTVAQLLSIPRFLLALVSATTGFSMMVFTMVLIPLVMDYYHFSFMDAAHVLQFHSVGMFLPGLFLGFLIERYGTILFILIGLITLICSNVIMMSGTDYLNFLFGMFFSGVGWNLVFVSGTTTLIQTYRPSEKATAQGINDFILSFTVSTFSLGAAWLHGLLGSWKATNTFSLLLCLAVFIGTIVLLYQERLRTFTQRKTTEEHLELILNPETTDETKS